MSLVTFGQSLAAFQIRGKIGEPSGCGIARCGHAKAGSNSIHKGVYQVRHNSKGQVIAKTKYYRPTNPRTALQQANRTKFTNAMTAWGALTIEQKLAYTNRAKRRNMFGWSLFIREYYQSN